MSPTGPVAPMVSVVVPTYRRPEMIDGVIACVVDQTSSDWELIIVDDNGDGSAAQIETEAVVTRYRRDARIVYVKHERNAGACAARNTGLRRARGAYVAFLDDDDVWFAEKLERQLAGFAAGDPDVALVYGGWRYVYEDGRVEVVMPDGSEQRLPELLKGNRIGSTSLVMCRRDALLAIDGFDALLPAMQDLDLYVRLRLRFPFAHVDDLLMDYRPHGGPRITTNPRAVEEANERFYAKHRHLLEGDAEVHHARLRAYALDMLRAGQFAKARRLYRTAWRLRPANVNVLLLGCFASKPLVMSFRRAKRWLRSRARPSPPPTARQTQDRRAS